jgi:cytochrome c556
MQDAFGIVLFVVVGVGFVVALITLFGRGRMYDDIGRGGLSIGEDRDLRRNAPAAAPISRADRDDEIRQMLQARNARRMARGEAPVDVEQELQELTRPPAAQDPEIMEEVRTLVEARNARRIARGQEPLDVEAEVARQLRDLPG